MFVRSSKVSSCVVVIIGGGGGVKGYVGDISRSISDDISGNVINSGVI